MKHLFNNLSSEEKNRILEIHKTATDKHYLTENFKLNNFNNSRPIVESANFEELKAESNKQSGILQLDKNDLKKLEGVLENDGYRKQMGSLGISKIEEGKFIWVKSLSGMSGTSTAQDLQNMKSLKEYGESVGQYVRYEKKSGSSFKNITFYKIIKK